MRSALDVGSKFTFTMKVFNINHGKNVKTVIEESAESEQTNILLEEQKQEPESIGENN